jgi:hypothetical protein
VRRRGITKEVWFLAKGPQGDQFDLYPEPADSDATLASYTASNDPFEAWFNQRLQAVTGFAVGDAEVQAETPFTRATPSLRDLTRSLVLPS